jgi:hypothetical protein
MSNTTQKSIEDIMDNQIMLITNAPLQCFDFDSELMGLAEQMAKQFKIIKK